MFSPWGSWQVVTEDAARDRLFVRKETNSKGWDSTWGESTYHEHQEASVWVRIPTSGAASGSRTLRWDTWLDHPDSYYDVASDPQTVTSDPFNNDPPVKPTPKRVTNSAPYEGGGLAYAPADQSPDSVLANPDQQILWQVLDPGGVGHHWIPQAVTTRLGSRLTDKASKLFRSATTGALPYDHGYDTWNGVTHAKYSNGVETLLGAYSAKVGKIGPVQSQTFLDYIMTGKTKDEALTKIVSANAEAAKTVAKWRSGFLRSVAYANAAVDAARKAKVTLTKQEIKAIAQKQVNQVAQFADPVNTKNARLIDKAVAGLSKSDVTRYMKGALRALGPVLAAGTAANAYANGSRNGHTGVLGALDEGIADMMAADLVEEHVFQPIVEAIESIDLVPNQRVRRWGFDEAGFPD